MRIVMLGPPGAGKGTQAKRVSVKLNLPHLSTGELLREAVSNNTSLGRKAKSYMSRGELVPDSIILNMVEKEIDKYEEKGGFILDGFPRNVAQAKKLDGYLEKKSEALEMVINIDVDEETAVKRLTGRLVCPNCGKLYHATNAPSDGACKGCGTELRKREDDNEKTIRNRLEVYFDETHPLIEYYREKGILRNISGKGSPDEIFQKILILIAQIKVKKS
ncbi:adenylate kinase [Candidatus Aerophobetes bacterium]|nr:adenylate kinase [Candidatus Aerophobetes bacterium]